MDEQTNGTAAGDNSSQCCQANFFSACSPSHWTQDCTRQLSAAATTVVVLLLVTAVNGGILVYDGVASDTYRTMTNKLVALMSAYNVLTTAAVVPIAMFRQFCIRLDSRFCAAHVFVMLSLLLQGRSLLVLMQFLTGSHTVGYQLTPNTVTSFAKNIV